MPRLGIDPNYPSELHIPFYRKEGSAFYKNKYHSFRESQPFRWLWVKPPTWKSWEFWEKRLEDDENMDFIFEVLKRTIKEKISVILKEKKSQTDSK